MAGRSHNLLALHAAKFQKILSRSIFNGKNYLEELNY